MADFTEIKIRIKGEHEGSRASNNKTYECYDEIKLSQDCLALKELVEKTKSAFNGQIDDILVIAKYQWK